MLPISLQLSYENLVLDWDNNLHLSDKFEYSHYLFSG